MMSGDPPSGLWALVYVTGPGEEWRTRQLVQMTMNMPQDYHFSGCDRVVDESATRLELGILVGPWKELARLKWGESFNVHGTTYTVASKADGADPFEVKFTRRGASQDTDELIDFTAVAQNGTEVAAEQYEQAIAFGRKAAIDFDGRPDFEGLSKLKVAYFRIMGRKRQWITFSNFATQPNTPPPNLVTPADVENARTLACQRADQAKLDELLKQRAAWRAIPPDPTNPTGAARLLVDRIQQGDERGVRQLLTATRPELVAMLDPIARFFVETQINRQKLVELFGELPLRREQLMSGVCSDAKEELLGRPWKPGPDGSYSQSDDGMVMRKGADGKYCLDLERAINPQTMKMIETLIELSDRLWERLAKNPPPTLAEVKALIQMPATTNPSK